MSSLYHLRITSVCLPLTPLLRSVLDAFEREAKPAASSLDKAIIMGDFNDANVILATGSDVLPCDKVVGIIDFGDMVYTWRVNEIAIAMAYAMLSSWSLPPLPVETRAHLPETKLIGINCLAAMFVTDLFLPQKSQLSSMNRSGFRVDDWQSSVCSTIGDW